MKLHLGSGSRLLDGWLNVDEWEGYPSLTPEQYLRHDLRHPVPLPDGCADYVYSEHFIEHLDLEAGTRMFGEMFRLLKSGGIMRVSTPNLAELVDAYIHRDIRRWQSWQPESPARILNDGLTSWGHKFTYDEQEIRDTIIKVGFVDLVMREWGKSDHEALRGLEHRPQQKDLILEAKKP